MNLNSKKTAWFRSPWMWFLVAIPAAGLLLAWGWRSIHPPLPVGRLLREARQALADHDYETAGLYCRQALQQAPDHVPALLLAGETAMRVEQFDAALEFFRAVPHSDSDESVAAQLAAAEVFRATGRLSDAERDYREVITWRPDHIVAHERLAFILDLQGRRWESMPHLFEQLRQDQISFSCLIRLGSRDSAIPFPDELEKIRLANHDPAAVMLADAVTAIAQQQSEKAEQLLRECLRLQPNFAEAHARLGRLLADSDMARVPAWQSQLPIEVTEDAYPDLDVVRGLWCLHVGQTQAAMRCFWTAATADPNHRIAQYQLGQLLSAPEFAEKQEFAEAAPRFAERSRLLQRLAASMSQLSLNRDDIVAMQSASELLEQLGRYWESYGWCGMVLVTDPQQDSARLRMQALSRQLSPSQPLTDPQTNPAAQLDLSSFPLPDWPDADIEL